jgi:hypothetical protein
VSGPVEHADLGSLIDRRNLLARQYTALGDEVDRLDREIRALDEENERKRLFVEAQRSADELLKVADDSE